MHQSIGELALHLMVLNNFIHKCLIMESGKRRLEIYGIANISRRVPFKTVEDRLVRELGLRKSRSISPFLDVYFNDNPIALDLSFSTERGYQMIRCHSVYESGNSEPEIRQSRQVKKDTLLSVTNIQAFLKIENVPIKDFNEELKALRLAGNYFLTVCGNRNVYSTRQHGLDTEVVCDRMINPSANFIGAQTEIDVTAGELADENPINGRIIGCCQNVFDYMYETMFPVLWKIGLSKSETALIQNYHEILLSKNTQLLK